MGVGPKGDDTAAIGAPIAFEIKTAGKAVEVPGSKAVAPDLIVAALGTNCGPYPRIILALLKNILEKNGDKIYHVTCVCLGHRPRLYRAESLSELSACLKIKKRTPSKGPNNPITAAVLSTYSGKILPQLVKLMRELTLIWSRVFFML
jgi:hypothetical protein